MTKNTLLASCLGLSLLGCIQAQTADQPVPSFEDLLEQSDKSTTVLHLGDHVVTASITDIGQPCGVVDDYEDPNAPPAASILLYRLQFSPSDFAAVKITNLTSFTGGDKKFCKELGGDTRSPQHRTFGGLTDTKTIANVQGLTYKLEFADATYCVWGYGTAFSQSECP